MRLRFRDDLPKYSDFFRTEHDEQRNVGVLNAHHSILSVPKFSSSKSALKLQRIAVIWDEDHDERVIDILEAAYFENLLDPLLFIGEWRGAVSVIVHSDLKQDELKSYERLWQIVSDKAVQGDTFRVDVMTREEYVSTAEPDLGPKLLSYLNYIDDAWDLGLHTYHAKPAGSRRASLRSTRPAHGGKGW